MENAEAVGLFKKAMLASNAFYVLQERAFLAGIASVKDNTIYEGEWTRTDAGKFWDWFGSEYGEEE